MWCCSVDGLCWPRLLLLFCEVSEFCVRVACWFGVVVFCFLCEMLVWGACYDLGFFLLLILLLFVCYLVLCCGVLFLWNGSWVFGFIVDGLWLSKDGTCRDWFCCRVLFRWVAMVGLLSCWVYCASNCVGVSLAFACGFLGTFLFDFACVTCAVFVVVGGFC